MWPYWGDERCLGGSEGTGCLKESEGSFHGDLEVVKNKLSLPHSLARDHSRFRVTQHRL